MTRAQRVMIREARDAAVRASRKQRVPWIACPVHTYTVGLDDEGHIVGRCPGCAQDAAEALTKLRAVA